MKTIKDFEAHYLTTKEGKSRVAELEAALARQACRTITVRLPAGKPIRFGLIGDTHLGSIYENLPALRAFYEHCREVGIDTILHAGDVLDGEKMYKGHEYEIHQHGWEKQKRWFEKVAPRVDGITTYFITGNHDHSFRKHAGISVGPELETLRPDWKFIGAVEGKYVFEQGGKRFTVKLLHPDGGSSYAISYRTQKLIEGMEGGTKPDLLGIGNYHKAELLPSYRNVCALQVGTFQRQTQLFMLPKGLAAHMGGWVLEANIGKRCNTFKSQFVAFY